MKKLLRHTLFVFTVSGLLLVSGMAVFASQEGVSSMIPDTVTTTWTAQSPESGRQSGEGVRRGSVRSLFSSWFLQPFRSTANNNTQSEKLLSNVRVFPSPSGETLNLSFRLGKRTDVSIKIMDALGNELATLFSQTVDAGVQSQSLEIQQKLSSGFYFIRVSAETETVVKRISIL